MYIYLFGKEDRESWFVGLRVVHSAQQRRAV